MIVMERSSWVESATATNSDASATRSAPSGGISHYVTSVSGSFDAEVAGIALTLKQSGSEIAKWFVHNEFTLRFPSPIRIDPGKSVSLDLGGGGLTATGASTMTGYTL